MRIHFNNIAQVKRFAKSLSKASQNTLSTCHNSIAITSGHRNWHELISCYSEAGTGKANLTPIPLPVVVEFISTLSEKLQINPGTTLNNAIKAQILKHTITTSVIAIDVRTQLFEKSELPPVGRRKQGAIGILKSPGRNGESVILRNFGRPTRVISDKSADTAVADFEYISPKNPQPLFIPKRLYVPYGEWTESGGARVLFSRDYKPLWRLQEDTSPERLNPWERIKFEKQTWFWEDHEAPWLMETTFILEMERLNRERIVGTPKMVEILPILVKNDSVMDFADAVEVLREQEEIVQLKLAN